MKAFVVVSLVILAEALVPSAIKGVVRQYATKEEECGHLFGFGESEDREKSILEQIAAAQYEKAEYLGGELADAERINVFERLKEGEVTICAEFKRASPSKGPIAIDAKINEVAVAYADAGAALISVLTEPEWFQGSLEDMQTARKAVDSLENRPAILRKDFVINEQMIREARNFGADAVLLIVACLQKSQLKDLVDTCFRFGLEPLVEAHSEQEMHLALNSGARCIGINNRNLHTFKLDMDATRRLASLVSPSERVQYMIASLSGVASRADVEHLLTSANVDSVLVGESLMRAHDKRAAVRELLGFHSQDETTLLAKVCGITSMEDAKVACAAGAHFIGLIFAPKSKRCISQETAKAIVQSIRAFGERETRWTPPSTTQEKAHILRAATARGRPLSVAVVQNQPLDQVLDIIQNTGVDLIQLHGDEDETYANQLPIPFFRVLHVSQDHVQNIAINHAIPTNCFGFVADTATSDTRGGTGQQFDWSILTKLPSQIRSLVLIAGGVDAESIRDSDIKGILGFDASSRLEIQPGVKEHQKLHDYVNAVNTLSSSEEKR